MMISTFMQKKKQVLHIIPIIFCVLYRCDDDYNNNKCIYDYI